jgi:hypothetical protein
MMKEGFKGKSKGLRKFNRADARENGRFFRVEVRETDFYFKENGPLILQG